MCSVYMKGYGMTVWWKRGVIYQIYPNSFKDSSGDGIGDLRGVIAQLDYLQWLGVDAIWFSPIFPSPMADFGYDVSDYETINPRYGSLADFDELLSQSHRRGLKIILDLVPNHTSSQHPWFLESRASRDNPRRDWYIWRDPAPDGGPPNNWLAYFGGRAWTFDEHTGQYYLHNFLPEQPDLNWRNPDVKEAMFDVIHFWLGRGVDGFRIDVIDRILKDTQFRDNPPNPGWKEGDNLVWSLLRVYSEQQHEEIHDYMREFRAIFDAYPERVSIGEVDYGLTPHQLARYYGEEYDDQGDELHLPFNFTLIPLPWNAAAIRAHVDEYESVLPDYAWPNYVLANHDMPRVASKVGRDQARVAAMLLLTLRGTPTLYYGDELGMENVPIPPEKILDPQGRNTSGFNRDETRTPMQWDASPNAGFAAPGVETWLPVGENYREVNVAAQREDPASILSLYRRLLALRRESRGLSEGQYAPVDGVPVSCFVYTRSAPGDNYLIALNLSAQPQTITVPGGGSARVTVSAFADRDGETVNLDSFALRANEGLILKML